jgi:hypothetical protein
MASYKPWIALLWSESHSRSYGLSEEQARQGLEPPGPR